MSRVRVALALAFMAFTIGVSFVPHPADARMYRDCQGQNDQAIRIAQVGNATQRTDGPCSPAIAGVGGNVTVNSKCKTTNSTIGTQNNVTGTQNNVQGNQINAPGGVAVGRDVTNSPITIGPNR